jgi:predicted NBD/HSP70 family sugar kinase/plasmid maintenance system antidote protein VapI
MNRSKYNISRYAAITIRDVARLASVSTATVSHVINNSRHVSAQTRQQVEQAISELGYQPNLAGRLLADQKNSIGPRSKAAVSFRSAASVHVVEHAESEPATSSSAISLLKLVRARQPISRADIARHLKINRSTVTNICSPLLASGILQEAEGYGSLDTESQGGRPGVGIVLDTDNKYFIGINIGVRQSQVGAATIGGPILSEEAFDTPGEASDVIQLIRSSIANLRARINSGILAGVGVSVPGPACSERRRLLYAPHLGWRDIAIADTLQTSKGNNANGLDLTDVPVIVENDAMAAAMAEIHNRLSQDSCDDWQDFALVRAGTGIGVGLVRGGELYRGATPKGSWAGEFGHMTIVADGKPCPCGNRGCWERYASASSAASLYTGDRAIDKSRAPRFVEIVARAQAGERRAQATLERIGNYLGIGIANIIIGLGLSRIVVSGRIIHGWKFINGSLEAALKRSMAGRLTQWSIIAGNATGAGLGGALEIAMDHYINGIKVKAKN